jgi:5-methyltetrahydrofolate--homocysteine methyltransferase
MGTQVHARQPTIEDYGGPQFENSNEALNLTRPDMIREIHAAYFAAGADMVETNTFNGSASDLKGFGLEKKAREICLIATRLAREAADAYSTPSKPRFVAGSMGPTTRSITLGKGISFAEVVIELQPTFRRWLAGSRQYISKLRQRRRNR